MAVRQRYVLDANVLVSIVNSDDKEHWSCYSFFRNQNDDGKGTLGCPRDHLFRVSVIAITSISRASARPSGIQTLAFELREHRAVPRNQEVFD